MDSIKHVVLLDDNTINRIAAGEVVERPASVVKELVENSLDAGAKRIVVQVELGGRKLIRVVDDGLGMNGQDAILALQRHATSKIAHADDLFDIHTLGFRGEGLPSIASVSHLELVTKSANEVAGHKIVVQGGDIIESSEVGAADGTSLTVHDLFYNTPARLKFMKSPATELSYIVELVAKYAMGYPEVSFRLQQGNQEILVSPGAGDAIGAVSAVWGKDTARSLAPLETEAHGMKVTGFISPPHITRPNRVYQAWYVNRRPVKSRTLISALDEAYRSLTPERRFPVALIHIEMNPSKVDVNVHPSKIEVKFAREGDVFAAVHQAVNEALKKHGMIPDALSNTPRLMPPMWVGPSGQSFHPGNVQAAIGAFGPMAPNPFEDNLLVEQSSNPNVEQLSPAGRAMPFADLLPGLRVLGQYRNTYIICETSKGVVIVDQHVAHERVIYEKLCGIKGATLVDSQRLLTPVTLEVDRRAALMVREKLEELNQIGFELEPFGADTFILRAVPSASAEKNYEELLKDIIDELVDATVARRLPAAREQVWITASCKQAVKAGDSLTIAEMEALIRQLAETENPYLCPHGRPVTITITSDDLDRKFKRI